MGKFFNNIRQVFNIFLILLLVVLAAGVLVYYLASPEQRGVTFWISAGFMIFALVLETLQASGIAMRSDSSRNVPVSFSRVILGGIYFLFVLVMAFWNALDPFTGTKYMLIHIAGLVVFLVPMVLINMAELRLTGSGRRQQDEGRVNLSSLAKRVGYIVEDMKAAGIAPESLRPLVSLAEALRYSDPTPSDRKTERALEEAVKKLETMDKNDISAVLRACTLAERALSERNDAVMRAK